MATKAIELYRQLLSKQQQLSILFLSFYQSEKSLELTVTENNVCSSGFNEFLVKKVNESVSRTYPNKQQLSILFLSFYQAEKSLELTVTSKVF